MSVGTPPDHRRPATAPRRRGRAILVSPAEAGGLGDQAMLDVAATALTEAGYRVTLLPNPTPVRAPVAQSEVNGSRGKLRLALMAARARRVVVIGADILDGGYGPRLIMTRLKIAEFARLTGARVRVIGSSFSPDPDPGVLAYLRDKRWLEILARERVSQDRMQARLGRSVPLVADSAFLLRPEVTCPEAEEAVAFAKAQKADGRKILALNVSGLVFAKIAPGALEVFAGAVSDWIGAHADIAPMVVAHDRRPGKAGDLETCDRLAATLRHVAQDRTHYLRDGISAWDAKAVAAHIDMAFLCRMHFAIACLARGVPPLSLVSMGKFEGLMDHFGLTGLTLDPAVAAADPAMIHAALDDLVARAPDLRKRIEMALPEIREMSAKNYHGI